jgi:hypothetical protein
MCGASRVYVDGIPLTAISLRENPEEFMKCIGLLHAGRPQRDLVLVRLPLTNMSWETIQKTCFEKAADVLGMDVVAQYCSEVAVRYSGCYVANVALTASPGNRMEMEILFAYLVKSKEDDFKPEVTSSKPQRILTWNDFGTFVEAAWSPWAKKEK